MFRPVGHFVLRTPLLPLETLDDTPSDEVTARARLARILARPEVVEALRVAAPSVAASIPVWQTDPSSERGLRLQRTLANYVHRMVTRSTPAGLLAGVTLGEIGKATDLVLAPLSGYRKVSRVDIEALYGLATELQTDDALLLELVVQANPTIHRVGERFHYVKCTCGPDGRHFELTQIDCNPMLESMLGLVGQRVAELISAMSSAHGEFSRADIAAYVLQGVRANLLVTALEPSLTCDDAATEMLAKLAALPGTETKRASLQHLVDSLARYDASPWGLSSPPDLHGWGSRQTVLHKPAVRAELALGFAQQLLNVAELTTSIFGRQSDPLAGAKAAFEKRFGTAEVPLLAALDSETGIVFGQAETSRLLQGLIWDAPATSAVRAETPVKKWLDELLCDAAARGLKEIVLDPRELSHLRLDPPPRESVALTALLFGSAKSPRALLRDVWGPSSETLNGRFALSDPALKESVKRALRLEEAVRPEVIFAELVHAPKRAIGSVVTRPVLRDYEIPVFGRSGAPEERQIALSDLWLSLRDGRFVLYSRRLGKEVAPRATNAYVFSDDLPLFRFLSSLAREHSDALITWSWMGVDAPAYPQVRLGDVVLCEATWVVGRRTLSRLAAVEDVQRLGAQLGWPRYLHCRAGFSARSAVDLKDRESLDIFLQNYRNLEWVTVQEDLIRTHGSAVRGDSGTFHNEVLISAVASERHFAPVFPTESTAVRREFFPGDDWLYAKVFLSEASADEALTVLIAPLVEWARGKGQLRRWFFVRYDEGGNHLRLRFCGNPQWLREELFPRLREELDYALVNALVSSLEFGTYVREIERYGGPRSIDICEEWFEVDSDVVLALLASGPNPDARWKMALLLLRNTLDSLGFAADEQRSLLKGTRDSLFSEMSGGKQLQTSLSKKYRANQTEIDCILSDSPPAELSALVSTLEGHQERFRSIATRLAASKPSGGLLAVAQSLLHMQVNRWLREQPRQNELVLFDFLLRWLNSQSARPSAS